jgi:hypothetical protein
MSATDQFTENASLTAIAIAYRNPDVTLIADDVLPRIDAPGRSYKWHNYSDAANFTVPNTRVGRRSQPNQIEIEGSEQDGSVESYGIDVPLDNVTIEEARRNKFDPRRQATELATDVVMLDREVRVAGMITDANNYHADHKTTLSGTDMFTDPASDPITILEDMLDTCWIRPNQLTFGFPVWRAIRKHPKIMKAIHGNLGDEGRATRQQIADLLEVKRINVGESRVNIKRPGEAPVLQRTWGNSVSGQYINRAASTAGGVTFGFTAVFGKKVAGTLPANMGIRGGVLVRSAEEVAEHIVAQRAGFLISNAT